MLSIPVQLIAWKDHPWNDLLCVERVVKQLLTHSLLRAQISAVLEFLFILTLIFVQHFCLQCSALLVGVGRQEEHLACEKLSDELM